MKKSSFILSLFIIFAGQSFGQSDGRKTIKNDPWPIIRRSGDQLLEGDKPFRFMGLAAPNIQANESQVGAMEDTCHRSRGLCPIRCCKI